MGELTPEKAKQKHMKMKSQMIIVWSKWKASGNDKATLTRNRDTSSEIDNTKDVIDNHELDLMDANDEKNFLTGSSPSVLYFWKCCDEINLTIEVCQ